MIKKSFIIYLLLGISVAYSQTYEDVLRYNSFYHDGSSRFNSMGGAFGALGGDLSSISINPAGSSVFLESEFGISLNYKSQEIDNRFNSSLSSSKDDLISFNQAGFVLVYENRKSKFSVAYNMNRLNDFNDSFSFRGNNKSGILTIMILPIWSNAEISSSDSFGVSNESNVFFNIRDINNRNLIPLFVSCPTYYFPYSP